MSETGGVQIAYGDALDAFPAWQSLTEVSGWTVRRGRQDEFTRTGTGTATVFVNDETGYLGSGADLPVHIRITLRGAPIFRGFVDEINVDVHNAAAVSRVAIECVDAFDILAGIEVVDQFAFPGFSSVRLFGNIPPQESDGDVFYEDGQVDDRIIQVLADAGWDPGLQSIFSGNVNVMESVYDSGAASVLQVMQDAADAEFPSVANLFVGKEGEIKFRGRFARFNPTAYGISEWDAATGSQVTGGRAQIRVLEFTTSKKNVYNSALCYPDPNRHPADIVMTDQILVDEDSIDKWGIRSWSAENIITLRHNADGTTGAEQCQLFARYIIENYKEPVPRVSRLGFLTLLDRDPRASATWDLMTGVEIGDTVTLHTDWIGGTHFVEGITTTAEELNGDVPEVSVELDLSPAAHWTTDPF